MPPPSERPASSTLERAIPHRRWLALSVWAAALLLLLPQSSVQGVNSVAGTATGVTLGQLESAGERAMTLTPREKRCSLHAFPDASCTGVPPGTTLTPYRGSSTISAANTVIEGKRMGCIRVTAPGVVIRKSKISCANSAVASYDGDYSGTPLLLEDVEIDCQNGPGTAVGEARVTVRRANIHGCENGFDINQAITVEDSFIHDLWNGRGAHSDGIQLASGHLVGSGYVDGALNVKIIHNRIYGVGADGSLGTSAIISNPTGDENILIKDNLLAGGAYTLYCDYEGTATNYRVIDNHFSRRFSQKVGAFGPSDGCADEFLSGNVYHETRERVRLD